MNCCQKGIRKCVGCGACCLICPHSAIDINFSDKGFYEPSIDENLCTDCGLCCDVCYKYAEIKEYDIYKRSKVFAATNNYIDQLSEVSTVGVASRLADCFYDEGWDICGVAYDYLSHICRYVKAKGKSDVGEFKRSKYLQGYTVDGFRDVLISDKKALVFGLPCQLFGLKKVADHLLVNHRFYFVDFCCAGVPSALLWQRYRSYLKRIHGIYDIEEVSFRDKIKGWYRYSMTVKNAEGFNYSNSVFNDLFFAFFLRKICLSEACYDCIFRKKSTVADIRLGDFWGDKFKGWDEGVGLVGVFTDKGDYLFNKIKSYLRVLPCKPSDFFDSQKKSSIKMPKKPSFYDDLLQLMSDGKPLEDLFVMYDIQKIPMGGE